MFNEKPVEWSAAGQTWHFAFMDLDDFKLMNDTCGHEFGDIVLRGINNSFSEIVGDQGYVIRMGGDEFALLFMADNPESLLAEGVERVRAAICVPKQNGKICIRMSFGIVSVPAGVQILQEAAYSAADAALYAAKERKQTSDDKTVMVRVIAESST